MADALSFDPFDPARKNGFLIEWRLCDKNVLSKLGEAQRYITEASGGAITAAANCDAEKNAHATMLEFGPLNTKEELNTTIQLMKDFSANQIPKLLADFKEANNGADPIIELNGIGDFRKNVFFAATRGPGNSFLEIIQKNIQSCLHSAGLVASSEPKRALVTHITLGRCAAKKGCFQEYDQIISDPYFKKNLTNCGEIGEIVFCSRRHPSESKPPLILTLFAASSSSAAAAGGADEKKGEEEER